MVKRIDFNADIGESFGSYQLGLDTEIVKYISSANIATGFHAGDPNWMRKTVILAEKNGLGIGAHPSYPDLNGFGRREMTLSPYEIYNVVTYQIGALAAFVKGHKLRHVKPHGAMYNTAVKDAAVAIWTIPLATPPVVLPPRQRIPPTPAHCRILRPRQWRSRPGSCPQRGAP